MAISDLIAKANEPTFYQKVGFLAMKVAQNVVAEADTVDDHVVRLAYANRIFRGEDSLVLLAAHMIASNATLQSTINDGDEPTDSDLEFVFGTIWTARAKAFAP